MSKVELKYKKLFYLFVCVCVCVCLYANFQTCCVYNLLFTSSTCCCIAFHCLQFSNGSLLSVC